MARKTDDERVLWLIDRILASGAGVLSDEYDMVWFEGDDLLAALRPRGLPIGNLTSQFWANCYLNPFDHFVTRDLLAVPQGSGAYLRFVDDFIVFADDARTLLRCRTRIVERLARLRLTIHPTEPRPVTEGASFLGFRVFPERRHLLPRKAVHFGRRFRAMLRSYAAGDLPLDALTASVRGWVNHARYSNTVGLRKQVLSRCVRPIVTKPT